MNIKKPKLGDMVRVRYQDHMCRVQRDYFDIFEEGAGILTARGRFLGAVNGSWFVESDDFENRESVHTSVIVASCITEVKNFGHDDSPLPEDLEDLLKEAKEGS